MGTKRITRITSKPGLPRLPWQLPRSTQAAVGSYPGLPRLPWAAAVAAAAATEAAVAAAETAAACRLPPRGARWRQAAPSKIRLI